MSDQSPFDRRPDPVLGQAIREALAVDDSVGFVRRVLERAAAPTWWEVLGSWARPGIAAALLLAAGGGFWLGRATRGAGPPVVLEEFSDSAAGGAMTALLTSVTPPGVDVLFAVNENE